MKCDFNCNCVYFGFKLVKFDDDGRVGFYIFVYWEGFCKDCIKDYEILLYFGLLIVSFGIVEFE